MVNETTLNGVQRERTPTQQQHPQYQVHLPPDPSRRPPSAAQPVRAQVSPSNHPVAQTQSKALQDVSGTFVHSNAQRGSYLPSPTTTSPFRHFPPSSFPRNEYQGQYAVYQPSQFPNTPPHTYPYTHAHGYTPLPLEPAQYLQNPLGFRHIMQSHSPLEAGTHLPPLDNSVVYPTTYGAPAHSPLPPPLPSGSHGTSYTNQQYQTLSYPSSGTPYHYNHAYQSNPYHWYYSLPITPGFTEGIPVHYSPHFFPPPPHAHLSDLESRFSRVSIADGPTSPEQQTIPPAPQSALRPSQVSTPISISPSRPERLAPPPSLANTSPRSHSDRPLMRRPYHPNPPAHRSEWVMWIGNVPDDTSHDELWRYLTLPPSPGSDHSESEDSGVSSIFLISRSNCAFVNYETEKSLRRAIMRFNGRQMRPQEWRCPRLVCRARRKEDDLRAGVGGQRGMGVHTRYIREQRQKEKQDGTPSEDDPTLSLSSESGRPPTLPSLSSDEDTTRVGLSWEPSQCVRVPSNSSYSSTNSSLLSRYFPKRFFILKSLTQFDLDLSIENGLWATQKHNEAILDQAYRTSTDVFLIFGVNKSGEFYGYARMAGRILQEERRVSWASHSDPPSTSSSWLQVKRDADSQSPLTPANKTFFTPSEHRLVEESPLPITPSMGGILSSKPSPAEPHRSSAPAALGPQPPRALSAESPPTKFSLGTSGKPNSAGAHLSKDFIRPPHITLDKNAPVRAARSKGSKEETKIGSSALQPVQEENINAISGDGEEQTNEDTKAIPTDTGDDGRQTWGRSFKVEWICTERLPFHRTRHLRNPWNHDREIKVSRDGTELEPGVGQQLVEQWQMLAAAPTVETNKIATTMDERAIASTPALSSTRGKHGEGETR